MGSLFALTLLLRGVLAIGSSPYQFVHYTNLLSLTESAVVKHHPRHSWPRARRAAVDDGPPFIFAISEMMALKLLILDANVVIHLHELGIWS